MQSLETRVDRLERLMEEMWTWLREWSERQEEMLRKWQAQQEEERRKWAERQEQERLKWQKQQEEERRKWQKQQEEERQKWMARQEALLHQWMEKQEEERRKWAERQEQERLKWQKQQEEERRKWQKQQEEERRKWQAQQEEERRKWWEQRDKELREWRAQIDAMIRESNKRWGELARSLGAMVELLLYPSVPHIYEVVFNVPEEAIDFSATQVVRRINGRMREFDAVIGGPPGVMIVEIQRSWRTQDVEAFVARMTEVRTFFPEWKHRTFYGAIATLYFEADDPALHTAWKRGLFVYHIGVELLEPYLPEDFRPRQF